MNTVSINKTIKGYRELKNLTQAYMAEKTGMSQGNYSKIELGTVKLTYETFVKICAVLDIEQSVLIESNKKMIYNLSK